MFDISEVSPDCLESQWVFLLLHWDTISSLVWARELFSYISLILPCSFSWSLTLSFWTTFRIQQRPKPCADFWSSLIHPFFILLFCLATSSYHRPRTPTSVSSTLWDGCVLPRQDLWSRMGPVGIKPGQLWNSVTVLLSHEVSSGPPIVQCLKIIVSYILFSFLIVYGRRVNPAPFIPSWSETKVFLFHAHWIIQASLWETDQRDKMEFVTKVPQLSGDCTKISVSLGSLSWADNNWRQCHHTPWFLIQNIYFTNVC